MKSFSKFFRIMVAALALTVAFSFAGNTANAAKKKKATMVAGETLNIYTIGGKLKSVKSSKKSVCSVKKSNGEALLTAKKAGKATITLKTTNGKIVYTITVKKNPFKVTYKQIKDGYIMVTVKNDSNVYFNSVSLSAVFCDAAGNPITQKSGSVAYLGAKQTGYVQISASQSGIDFSKTQVGVDKWSRYPNSKYKSYSKNVKATYGLDNGYYKLNASTNYSGKGGIHIAYDIGFKDASGNIVRVYNETMYLYNTKKVDTTYGTRLLSGETGYEILSKRVILETY